MSDEITQKTEYDIIRNMATANGDLKHSILMLAHKQEYFEKELGRVEKESSSLTKADIVAIVKDVHNLSDDIKEIKDSLKPLKDYPLVRTLCFSGVGVILIGVLSFAGSALIKTMLGG